MVNQYVSNIVDAISRLSEDGSQLSRVRTLAAELSWAKEDEIDFLLSELCNLDSDLDDPSVDPSIEIVIGRLLNDLRESKASELSAKRLELLTELYLKLPPDSRVRSYLLGWMSSVDLESSLERFAQLIVDNPPRSTESVVIAFAPLVDSSRQLPIRVIFPQLLDGLQHVSVAAAILDLANFLTRQRRVEHHPATERIEQLAKTLGMLTERLEMLEQGQPPSNATANQISQMVNESVSLITSLCDAIALIGDRQAVQPLNRTAELKHRRIRTEALSALYQLGQSEAAQELIQLAAEPIARVRVLAYAEELDLIDQIPESYQTPIARAESELAIWLAHPSNMGIAPNTLELADCRQLMWPSFDDPVDCFLFRYRYEFAAEKIENIGIAGPLTHAFAIQMSNLSIADMYACFAGWQCAHDDIVELSVEQARAEKPGSIERLMSRLANDSIEESSMLDVEPCFLGMFMGDEVLVASGKKNKQLGTYVVDAQEVAWFDPMNEKSDGMDELAYCIYKGRKLLGAFNTPNDWPGTE